MASNLWRAKDTLYFTLGTLFLIAGAIGILIGVAYAYGWPRYDAVALPVLGGFCTLTGVVPGVLLLFMGLRAHRVEKDLVEFAAWVRTYRRVLLSDLAGKLGKAPYETEKILLQVVDRGLVRGFIDRQTNEFVLQEVVGSELFVDRCPRCGAALQRRYLPGETVVCPFCSSVIVGPAPPARTA